MAAELDSSSRIITTLNVAGGFVENQSFSEERQPIEEVVEENEEERVPHDNFYCGDYEDSPRPPRKRSKHTRFAESLLKMGVVPNRYVRGFLDILLFIICLILITIQFGLIDFYYLTVLKDNIWYAWIGADSMVIVILIWLMVTVARSNQQHMEDACSTDAKVKFAWIGWLAYSIVLVGKVSVCFRLFYDQLPPSVTQTENKLFDDHLFRLGLSLSIPIFLLLLESHHYTTLCSGRQLYLIYLITAITLDLTDTICFLDLLWQSFKYKWGLPLWLELTILTLATGNFILPAFALLRLRFGLRLPRITLFSEKIWSLIYVLIVNGPYLGLRIYLYILLEVSSQNKNYDASIFIMKNIIMIYLAIKEVWTRLQYWRHKRNINGSRGELTAPNACNDNET